MSRKRWLALIAAAMLVVASVAFNAASVVISSNFESVFGAGEHEWTEHIVEYGDELTGKIALLEINGTIQDTGDNPSFFETEGYRHRLFLSQLDHVAQDASVEGIIIRVNTPGGGVVESAEIYDKIIEAKKEYEKPIFVSMGSLAASGGYYISAPADKIVATPQTITGSLGVIMESINVAELAEKYGVKFDTIKSGPYKDMMSPTREMTEGERAILQSLIDESYEEFVRIIAEGRQMSEQEVRRLADGRIYSGLQAKELNLVDELGNLDDTIELMKEHVGDYNVVRFESNLGLNSLFAMSVQRIFSSDHELMNLQKLISEHRAPTLKYLYTQ
ncbi:signal peptide peptidase SppA [Halalkalibacter urbisdiaboli]|uniref:signal peptide peptidase SppA n=1 Tax=Halalkalibacter urbisdiaboli TaxID=1960589 RepID=UPI000B44E835|nr:signal peptide peptidase SppA [Halalkalibacter urbisdiaboli]